MVRKCKYENKNGTCGLKGCYVYRRKCYTEDLCKCFEPITNADRIRTMSDEGLAKFLLARVECDNERYMCNPAERGARRKCDGRCVNGRLNWLRSEAKEEAE